MLVRTLGPRIRLGKVARIDQPISMLLLQFLEMITELVNIITKLLGNLPPYSAHFIDQWIGAFARRTSVKFRGD